MDIIPFDEALRVPLASDALVEERVARLVGKATSRVIWVLQLDEHNIQHRQIITHEDYANMPDDYARAMWESKMQELSEHHTLHSVIVVIERWASDRLTPGDLEWARVLWRSCRAALVPVRAIVLSHRDGVRWVALDDYGFGA